MYTRSYKKLKYSLRPGLRGIYKIKRNYGIKDLILILVDSRCHNILKRKIGKRDVTIL